MSPVIKLGTLKVPRHKLRMQLIPESSWYYNLRKVLPPEEWNSLRKKVYAYFGYQCAACGSPGPLHAHEVWSFRTPGVQRLVRLVALCELCHAVEHFGRTELLNRLYLAKVVKHGMKVLKCSFNQFQRRRDKAFKLWASRNLKAWKVDFGPYTRLVKEEGNALKFRNSSSRH